MSHAPLVICPQCGKSSVFSSGNPSRPFCSQRCKLIDLGAWANESYRVPSGEKPEPGENKLIPEPE
ncbi:MAG: DNA gyrase inhibitor YacG [Burkholderiales bacterium]|nr:DNA gyrase inhibitor YacG [Pseudomonadota bacterium]